MRVVLTLIRGYKVCISPFFRGSCRFLPSCADYSAEAFRRHGLAGGAWLTVRRLARCQPLCRHGYDPVPDTWRLPSVVRTFRSAGAIRHAK